MEYNIHLKKDAGTKNIKKKSTKAAQRLVVMQELQDAYLVELSKLEKEDTENILANILSRNCMKWKQMRNLK